MPHQGLVKKRLTRVGVFNVGEMNTALRLGVGGFGQDAIVDLLSSTPDEWIDITSDHWGEVTEANIQSLVNAVQVPITYEQSLRLYTENPTWQAVIQWIGDEHGKTPATVTSELRTILIDLAGD
tara:strand:+ start:4172 stop:4543 length:372 start_codon:yes stop_codon:yes gene_type:complete